MITCPYCGTAYSSFQPNCKNCGAPLPPPAPASQAQPASPAGWPAASPAPAPPPPPRPVADSYAWRLLLTDGWAIASFVFLLLGAIFTLTGAALTLGIITAIVGLPFLGLGLLFLIGGGAVVYSRYSAARQTVQVLREGRAVEGAIARVDQNRNVDGEWPQPVDHYLRLPGGRPAH